MKPCLFVMHIYPVETPLGFEVCLTDAVGVTHCKSADRLSDLSKTAGYLVAEGVVRVTHGAVDGVREFIHKTESSFVREEE